MSDRRKSVVFPAAPGDVLREALENREITQDELAAAMRVSRYSVNQLVNERRTVTPMMALRLSKALGTTPNFWLNIQQELDLFKARRTHATILAAIRPLAKPRRSPSGLFGRPGEVQNGITYTIVGGQ